VVKEMGHCVRVNLIPRLRVLRRVPQHYRRTLPLEVMKRYQCLVVGSAQGKLTVGITDRCTTHIIDLLALLTGNTIFPVLIEQTRMRLLLRRIEHYERHREYRYELRRTRLYHPLQVHSMLTFIMQPR
jgi:hypothetical protein